MHTQTKEQCIEKVKAMDFYETDITDKLCQIVELAYDSGHHDGWYEHVNAIKKYEGPENWWAWLRWWWSQ